MPLSIRRLFTPATRIALAGFAVLLIALPQIRADFGRNGGIVILPSATHTSEWGKHAPTTIAEFPIASDVLLQLPGNLTNVSVVVDLGNGVVSVGSLSGSLFGIRASELQALAASGMTRFEVILLDTNQFGYNLQVLLQEDGKVEVVRL